MKTFTALFLVCSGLLLVAAPPVAGAELAPAPAPAQEQIDFNRARQLIEKRRSGETLTAAEAAFLQKAIQARNRGAARPGQAAIQPRDATGLRPLTEFRADDRYLGEEGGLYGSGRNTPPDVHRRAIEIESAKIQPLDPTGTASAEGRIVFISISMSNATQEFSTFKRRADDDPEKAPRLVIVDCAQGGQAMAEWVDPEGRPWAEAARRLEAAKVTDQQVQVAWVKLANKSPRGDLHEHGAKLQRDTLAVLQNAKGKFPNLRLVYLGSRIYGGYATSALNPEPYAYESAYVCRWLVQAQIDGAPELNHDPERGAVKVPVLLWGPYLWADGATPRESDGLVWTRDDFAGDGTHPSQAGRDKVARLLLEFFKTDPLAKPWFTK